MMSEPLAWRTRAAAFERARQLGHAEIKPSSEKILIIDGPPGVGAPSWSADMDVCERCGGTIYERTSAEFDGVALRYGCDNVFRGPLIPFEEDQARIAHIFEKKAKFLKGEYP